MAPEDTRKSLLASAFSSGAMALLTQALLFRELSIILRSNDLIVGILLSLWLLMTGLGSISAPFGKKWFVCYTVQTITSALSIVWLYILANVLSPGIGQIWPFYKCVLLILLSSAPIAITTGSLFASLSSAYRHFGDPAQVYIREGAGSLVGGMLSLFMAIFLPPQVGISVTAGVSFAGLLIYTSKSKKTLTCIAGLILVFSTIPLLDNAHERLTESLYGGYSVERYESTKGAIQILRRENETYLYQNGVYLGSARDTADSAPLMHGILADSRKGGDYLLAGGILQGAVNSILAHDPKSVTVLVNDPRTLEIGIAEFSAFRKLDDPRIKVIPGDPVRSIEKLDGKFDYILLFPGIPQSSGDSRILTHRLFATLTELRKPSGKLFVGFPAAPNLVTNEEAEMLASISKTISDFGQVTAYMGENTALLVHPDNGEWGDFLRNIKPDGHGGLEAYHFALPTLFESFRQESLRERIAQTDIPVNTWNKPAVLLIGLRRWENLADGGFLTAMSSIPYSAWLVVLGLLALVSAPFSLSKKVPSAMIFVIALFTGALGMGSSIWLMYYFQVVGGQLYFAIGILSGLFIMGSIYGALLASRGKIGFGFWRLSLLIFVASIGVLSYSTIINFPIWLAIIVFGAYHLLVGGVVGMLYPLLLYTADEKGLMGKKSPAVIYSADLIGSALTAPFFGILIIPVFGMTRALFLLIALYGLIMIVSLSMRNK